jgi:histidine triad (HIT) family protein
MEDSIFTKIVNGDIPCHKVYEDEKTIAFLDIHPVQAGHVLVIPKKQVEFVWDLDEDDYAALMAACKKLAVHMRDALGVRYVGSRVIGTDVPHAHVHLIPFNRSAELMVQPDMIAEPRHDELAKVAEKLRLS